MALPDLSALPRSFQDAASVVGAELAVIDSVLDPVLVIRRDEGRYRAFLEAVRMRRGEAFPMRAPGLDFAWVHDETSIRPLPLDIAGIVAERLEGLDPDDLAFPEVLALERRSDDRLGVRIAPDSLADASTRTLASPDGFDVPGLNATLYPYQAGGVAWISDTVREAGGIVLADEMGLGKTVQIIGALLLDPPSSDAPALILAPTTLIANWVRELTRFSPGLSVRVHRGPDRARLPRDLLGAQVLITTYDTAVNDLVLFRALEWSWLVCDEAQAVKNPVSQRRLAVASIPRRRTVPVTGTPVENHLLDLWSLVDLAVPGLLGDQSVFETRFPDDEQAARELAGITAPVVLRRRVKDVANDLPPRTDVEVPVELGAALAADYDAVLDETLERYPAAGALVATGQLQLFCAHPWLRSPDTAATDWEDRTEIARGSGSDLMTPKLERAVQLLTEAFHNRRKVLIFANFNACGPILREAAERVGAPKAFWGAINGSTPSDERQPMVDAFTAFEGPAVLVLNPRAAGAGLNITAATVVIHFTQVWNPALELQASARAHRRGQTEPVTVYHMYYVDTVEEVMMERARRRREMGAEAVPPSGQEREDLQRALSLRPTP
ncbi:MAG: SNF2 family DNA or RNA helicase [Brevundimonas sp.]|jgi:SNF2 family DNA or RNA helicase|uniref:DEAD/DEAH box helicase n=1 Tax=Brevundimonas sp. TaxID=1871086 RepID=UPI0039E6B4A5